MASSVSVLLAAAAAIAFYSLLGHAIGLRLRPLWAPRGAFAPALGWAVSSAVAYPLHTLLGFNRFSATMFVLAGAAASTVLLRGHDRARQAPTLPWWAFIVAAMIAAVPLAALLPKAADGGVILGITAFDHSKVAMIDEMTRLGLPPGNPFFGLGGSRGVLSYYLLWHFSAAQLSIVAGVSGWEADAAMTGFTAYASLLLMMGLSTQIRRRWGGGVGRAPPPGAPLRGSRRPGAAPPRAQEVPGARTAVALVALLSLAGSLRPLLGAAIGEEAFKRLLSDYYPVEAWMDQVSWAPQHVAAAWCVVIAVLLLADLAQRPSLPASLLLGAVAAAGVGASTWVGGVTFAVVAAGVGGALLVAGPTWRTRWRFVFCAALGAGFALLLALPLLGAEVGLAAARGGAPVALHPYEVFGPGLPASLRGLLNLPGYWLVRLPLDLPAIYPAAAAALLMRPVRLLRPGRTGAQALALAVLTAGSLGVAWLLASVIGNNDLGWRAVLPSILVMTPVAAAALAAWIDLKLYARAAPAAALVIASTPNGMIGADLGGRHTENAPDFAAAPALFAAVRRHAGPSDRIANNPQFLDDLTNWPVNLSWALLSDRPSCYAGLETARAAVVMPLARLTQIDQLFTRVFDGTGGAADVEDMARIYGCRVVAVTESDGAWSADPFARSPAYRLAEVRPGAFRIYVATSPSAPSPKAGP